MFSRRKFLTSAAFAAPMIISLPRSAFSATRNPVDFGTVGSGDDTAAINGALAAIRTDFGGKLELDGKLTAGGYSAFYDVAPLNATLCSRMKIDFDPRVTLRGSQMAGPGGIGAILDLTGSHEVDCEYGAIFGGLGDPWGPSPPAAKPLCAVLVANNVDKVRFVSLKMTGYFKSGVFCVFDSASIMLENCQLIQRSDVDPAFGAAPPALMMSSNPGEWGCTSRFQTLVPGISAVTNFQSIASEYHAISSPGPVGTGWAIYMRNTLNSNFFGGSIDCSKSGHFLFQGGNSGITLDGVSFYSELGHNPSYIFENQGGTSGVRNILPFPADLRGSCTAGIIGGTPIANYATL